MLEDSSYMYFKSSCLQEGNIWNPVKGTITNPQLLDTVNEVIFLAVIGQCRNNVNDKSTTN